MRALVDPKTKVAEMDAHDKPPEEPRRSLTVTWPHEAWVRIEAAARLLSEQEHFDVTPTDIVRSGAIRRAEDVLSTSQAA